MEKLQEDRALGSSGRVRARVGRDKARSQSGSLIILAVATLFLLVPFGLVSYEVVMARQQYNQLKAATDASALAAATYLNDSVDRDKDTAQEIGLIYFRKNRLISVKLSGATLSPTALSDSPAAGESRFRLVSKDGSVTAESACGVRPFFLSNLGTYTLHASSTAVLPKGLKGDVVLVLDLSGSMTYATRTNPKTVNVTRTYHSSSNFIDYQIEGPPGDQRPAKGWLEMGRCIPNPSLITYYPPGETAPVPPPAPASVPQPAIDDHTPKMQSAIDLFRTLGNSKPIKPGTERSVTEDDIKLALLLEAKKGNLESKASWQSKKANVTDLKFVPNFESLLNTPGFQLEYQRIALTVEDPLYTAKKAIHFFLDARQSASVHWALVGYGQRAGRESDLDAGITGTTLDPARPGEFCFPVVPLKASKNQGDGGVQSVKSALDMSTVSSGTNTPAGMAEAIKQLTGPGHTKGWDRTMIVLTDGMPTEAGAGLQVQEAQRKNIKVIFLGYFLGSYALPDGPRFCDSMKELGAQAFYIPDAADPEQGAQGLNPETLTSGQIDEATLAVVEEVMKKYMEKMTSGTGVYLR